MKPELLTFYRINRNIFAICPRSQAFFRLSDCKIYLRTRPKRDWLDEIERETARIDQSEEILDCREDKLREGARIKGRALALKSARKLDPVFTPRKLNPDDAKVLFHPVDYVVFNGMKVGRLRSVLLLDRDTVNTERTRLRRSIEKTVEKGNYEWLTIRIDGKGYVNEAN